MIVNFSLRSEGINPDEIIRHKSKFVVTAQPIDFVESNTHQTTQTQDCYNFCKTACVYGAASCAGGCCSSLVARGMYQCGVPLHTSMRAGVMMSAICAAGITHNYYKNKGQ